VTLPSTVKSPVPLSVATVVVPYLKNKVEPLCVMLKLVTLPEICNELALPAVAA